MRVRERTQAHTRQRAGASTCVREVRGFVCAFASVYVSKYLHMSPRVLIQVYSDVRRALLTLACTLTSPHARVCVRMRVRAHAPGARARV